MLIWLLLGWPVLSVFFGLAVGPVIRVGMGSGEPTEGEKQVVFDAIDAWKA